VLTLMPGYRRDGTIAWRHGRAVAHQAFLTQVAEIAKTLPDAPCLINLCEDRYLFMLSLCASLLRGGSTLLPPNRLATTVREIAGRYPGAVTLADGPIEDMGLPNHLILEPVARTECDESPLDIAPALADRPDAIIAFTSGSTGSPQPNPKRWIDQMHCSLCGCQRFGIRPETSIIATVPPQHMFGLELSVLIPLAIGAAAHSGRPFFPEDICAALAETPGPRVLVTTPVHLNACINAHLDWPEIDFVISATAPLSDALARTAEDQLKTRIFEIYGCTEAGSVASRRTVEGPRWEWYDTVEAHTSQGSVSLTASFLPGQIPLNDLIQQEGARHFRLIGRGADMVNVAGKRASLADLNLKLNAIPGVKEGVIFVPESADETRTRLAAMVVAPELDRSTLAARLRELMDPVFIPRPIIFVDELPRNDVGKTPRQWLLKLLEQQRSGPEQ
jgi:acyl-coenzyme A synthetase/AMP-(fatty) acid ligase